jgi:S1-C subfamily serine protease
MVNDLIKFGTVQRAYLGISYPVENLSEEQKKEIGYKEGEGVFVTDVTKDGAAIAAGVQKGDIVTKINGVPVTTGPEMVEQVTRYKPGDKISLAYLRNNKENTVNLTLKNKVGNFDVVKSQSIVDKLGGTLETLDKKKSTSYDIAGGVLVKSVGSGILSKTKMQDNFVIVSVNGQPIKTLDELKLALERAKGYTVKLEGIYPGYEGSYGYPLNLGAE